MNLKIKLLSPEAKLPLRQVGSVGFDCFSIESGVINALERRLIPLGFTSEIEEGYFAKIFDRSGMGNKGITSFAGVIDADYRGEWKVILYNSTGQGFNYKIGDKICQFVILPAIPVSLFQVESVSETKRGTGGLGSTDIIIENHDDIVKFYSGMDLDLAHYLWIMGHKDKICKIRGWTLPEKQTVMEYAKDWLKSKCERGVLLAIPEILQR